MLSRTLLSVLLSVSQTRGVPMAIYCRLYTDYGYGCDVDIVDSTFYNPTLNMELSLKYSKLSIITIKHRTL